MSTPDYVPNTVAKCGWVLRQTSVLRRWKLSWLVLYKTGRLSCFDSQQSQSPCETVMVPYSSVSILPSDEISLKPPEGKQSDFLFGYKSYSNATYFCAEDSDDKEAWLTAIREAKNIEPIGVPGSYAAYYPYGTYVYPYDFPALYPAGVILPSGYYYNYPMRYRNSALGSGLACGLLAGTAAASMLCLWPWMWLI